MSSGPKKVENRGGARPGAGAKPQTLSARQVQLMLDHAKEYAEKHGKTVDEILLDFIYASKSKDADRLAAIKLFKTYTIAKLQEGGETDQQLGPAFFLPDQRPDPAKLHVLNGGKT
jgi:hypothetical protein